jgi:hypothetical protein
VLQAPRGLAQVPMRTCRHGLRILAPAALLNARNQGRDVLAVRASKSCTTCVKQDVRCSPLRGV